MRNKEKDELEMAERRNTILREGFRLFEAKGIETTGMQEIANACHLGIATLYRYYKNKIDLVIDIGTRQWQEYFVDIQKKRSQRNVDRMTAAENLEFYLSFYIDLYNNHKDLLRFNSNFNSYVMHEGVSAEQLKPYLKAIGSIAVLFHELYEKGKKRRDNPHRYAGRKDVRIDRAHHAGSCCQICPGSSLLCGERD